MATERTTSVTTVVLGPKTRLGTALLGTVTGPDQVYAVARDERDQAALASCGATVIGAHSSGPLLGDTRPNAVRIHVCALGPVHPETAQPGADATIVDRDLGVVARLLDEAEGRDVHVVLVSCVLALAPAADRAYYAGWKNVVEEELAVDRRRSSLRTALGALPGAADDRRGAAPARGTACTPRSNGSPLG